MSRENVELVTRAIRAATASPKPDFATMNEVFHPDHVFVPLTSVIDTEEVRGGRGYQAFLREQVRARDADSAGEASTSWEAELEGAIDVGPSKVLCVLSLSVRGSASGVELEQRTWLVATVRDGQVSRTEHYSDPAKALEAVGLSEQAASRTNPENVELARSYFEEIARASREDFDPETTISRMAEFWDPEIEWDTRGGPVEDISGVYQGIEGASQWCREWFEAWAALHFEYEVVDAGEQVVVTLPDLRMRGRSSGIEVAMGKHAWVITFRDGLMVHHKLYTSQAEALEAVGLRE